MSTEIGHLCLHLPAEFKPRAERIGRLVGHALAGYEMPVGHVARLAVGPLHLDSRHSDRSVAAQVARAIRVAIGRNFREG